MFRHSQYQYQEPNLPTKEDMFIYGRDGATLKEIAIFCGIKYKELTKEMRSEWNRGKVYGDYLIKASFIHRLDTPSNLQFIAANRTEYQKKIVQEVTNKPSFTRSAKDLASKPPSNGIPPIFDDKGELTQ
jgi:hypothetical protein